MYNYSYNISFNDSVNRWWLTHVTKMPFESPPKSFESDINLGEGYVQIIYPVREEFLKKHFIDSVDRYNGDYNYLYFPFENNKVEFTSFIDTPHYLSCYGKTDIFSEHDSIEPFKLYTCGGVKLWLNGVEVVNFAPYTRNIQSEVDINLHLKKGENNLEIYFDELAERDVFYYFDLRYCGDNQLNGSVEMDETPEKIKKCQKIMESCYFTKDLYEVGNVEIGYDNTLIQDFFSIKIMKGASTLPLFDADEDFTEYEVILTQKNDKVTVGKIDDFSLGMFKYDLIVSFKNFTIKRQLLTCVYPKDIKYKNIPESIVERKREAIKFAMRYGDRNINKTLAIIESEGVFNKEAKACFDISLDFVKQKKDCADFYLPGLIRAICEYKNIIPSESITELEDAIFNFRYWIDEPGNDVMWYFSENHAFLFHVNQYITGHLYPERTFYASGRKGNEQYKIGKKRLIDWFEVFFKYGYAEWNSVTYIPIDLIGLFMLYDYAPDNDIRDMAKKGLDFTFKILAYNNFNGILSSSYGRTYEHSLKGRELTETSFIEWISCGKGFVNFKNNSITSYCLSSYEPPSEYYDDVSIQKGEDVELTFTQGINETNIYSYKTNDYCISSVVKFNPFKKGHQQHLQNIGLGKKNLQVYINHPGERPFSGENRPSYWAGNGTMPLIHQYKGLQLIHYKLSEDDLVHYIHMYSTMYDYDNYELENHWFFGQVDDAYIAVYFSSDPEITSFGANTNKEIIAEGLEHGIIVRVGSKYEFGSFEAFKELIMASGVEFDNRTLTFNDPIYGECRINEKEDLLINKKVHHYNMKDTYRTRKSKLRSMI